MRRLVLIGWLLGVAAVGAAAEDGALTDSEVVVREEGAHRLLLPKDWPVEHADGRIAPVSVETYLSMKFGQVAAQFAALEQRLGSLERQLGRLAEAAMVLQTRVHRLEERVHTDDDGGR